MGQADFDRVESALACKLPRSYREVASRINFGHFTLGAIQFGSGRLVQAEELIAQNADDPWWGAGDRPIDLLSVGGGDPYVILLRLSDGAILAFDGELSWRTSHVVASNIEMFLRGLGTAYFLRLDKAASAIDPDLLNRSVGGDSPEFWRIALGRAA